MNTSIISHKPFYFMRHGETDWNRHKTELDSQNSPLNIYGKEQARSAAETLKGVNIESMISSPLLRATETAKVLLSTVPKSIMTLDELTEHNRNAEPMPHFEERVIRGLNLALECPGPVLIIGHSGTYRAWERMLSWQPFPDLRNCVILCHQPPKDITDTWKIHEVVTL